MSIAEYRVGIELAESAERAAARARALTAATSVIEQTNRTIVSFDARARFGALLDVSAIEA